MFIRVLLSSLGMLFFGALLFDLGYSTYLGAALCIVGFIGAVMAPTIKDLM